MMGNCYNCDQQGHPARLCPTKGKGKGPCAMKGSFGGYGGKGYKGKGNPWGGKGGKDQWGKGGGFGGGGFGGGKAGGKAFAGDCWKCGKKGHRALECRSAPAPANAVEQTQVQEVQIDSVHTSWPIGNVNRVVLSNRYGALDPMQPRKVEIDPSRMTKPENDSQWPQAKQQHATML